jgi:hypothetical protein
MKAQTLRHGWRILGTGLLFLVVSSLVGCSGKGTISGTVKKGDKNLAMGTITFYNKKDNKAYSGTIQEDGSYSVDGVPSGDYKVTISSDPPKKPTQGGGNLEQMKDMKMPDTAKKKFEQDQKRYDTLVGEIHPHRQEIRGFGQNAPGVHGERGQELKGMGRFEVTAAARGNGRQPQSEDRGTRPRAPRSSLFLRPVGPGGPARPGRWWPPGAASVTMNRRPSLRDPGTSMSIPLLAGNTSRPGFRVGWLALVCLPAALAGLALGGCTRVEDKETPAESTAAEVTSAQVRQFCGHCHAYPPPNTFPKSAWRKEVNQGFDFFEASNLNLQAPSQEAVVRYYEGKAPKALKVLPNLNRPGPGPVRWRRTGYRVPGQPPHPAVSNVNLVHLYSDRQLDILTCDMRYGHVRVLSPYERTPKWKTLAKLAHPAHAEVVDLDNDGSKDILVADLGNFLPTDDKVGKVVLLKRQPGGTFRPITLLKGVGRVADVQAADFRGVGKKDLVVAVFGWQTTGEIIYLENHTTDWSRPRFKRRVLDDRHGTIHVPVTDVDGKMIDLNGDGKPDFIALISQEHETIVAFLNQGNGKFRKKTIYTAKHPAYGSSGIQVVDLNGDGKVDVLYTNGDVMDSYMLKPYHSVQWLENRGKFPFTHHHLTSMYGVHRAVAADFRHVGKKDIMAVSFLPVTRFPRRKALGLDAVIYLKQTAPGKFARYSLEKVTCNHVTCAAGDLYGDGRIHLVTGNFTMTEKETMADAVTVWENRK